VKIAMLSPQLALHFLGTLVFGAIVVTTPAPIELGALGIWAFLVNMWMRRHRRASGRRAGTADLVIQLVSMIWVLAAAELAPCKTVDRVKARTMTVPLQAMTIGQLQEPIEHNLDRPSFLYSIGAPTDIAGRIVSFPSRELGVSEFIAAIEAQTPLRHKFQHCGNGYTILWGKDYAFGLRFDAPHL
jgi:hypothetical protein